VDPSGAVVAGVQIEIRNIATNLVSRTITTVSGFYSVPGLAAGEYAVSATVQGFKRAVRSGITLQVDQRAVVDFTLEV